MMSSQLAIHISNFQPPELRSFHHLVRRDTRQRVKLQQLPLRWLYPSPESTFPRDSSRSNFRPVHRQNSQSSSPHKSLLYNRPSHTQRTRQCSLEECTRSCARCRRPRLCHRERLCREASRRCKAPRRRSACWPQACCR